MRSFSGSAVLIALIGVLACSHKDDDSGSVVIQSASQASAKTLGPGDVRIAATDGGVDLALIGDTISSGLSQSALAKAKAGTDTAAVKGSGFSASIEKMVKSSVQSALGTRVGFPLSDVKGARYENGRIEFDWAGEKKNIFENSKVNGRNVLESFSAADAQRFVDAVNERKKASVVK